ncbi:MAG: mechanosensitive ion channel family protein [Pseudomonadota bacterium]
MLRYLMRLIFVALGVMAFTPALAQLPTTSAEQPPEAVTLPDPLTPEAVRDMVSRLSDDQVRSLLLERLDAVAAATVTAEQDAGLATFARHATLGTYESVRIAIERLPVLWSSQAESFRNFSEAIGPNGLWILFAVIAMGVSAGLVAEFLFNRLTARWHHQATTDGPANLGDTLGFLFNRLCRDIFGVVVFFLVAENLGAQIAESVFDEAELVPIVPYIWIIWIYFIVIPRIASAFGRFVMAPRRPEYRVIPATDSFAWFAYYNQIGLPLLMGFSIAIVEFNVLNGVPMGESRLGFWLNLAVHLYIVVLAFWGWDGWVQMARGWEPELTRTEEWAARNYPWFCIGVSVGTWILVNIIVSYGAFDLLKNGAHYQMMLLLIFWPLFDILIRGMVRHLVPPMKGEGELAERAYQSTKRSYIRIGRVLTFGLMLILIAGMWKIDFHDLSAGTGVVIAARFFEILMILAIGYLVWELVSLYINAKLAAEQTAAGMDLSEDEPGGGEGGGAGGSRLSTVLPLVLGVLKAAIVVIFGLIALGNIGIDITPLLAGAGIIGLAIGFGAQKLVADVVSGIFFLVDDAFRTGEFVEVEGTVGTVERISIRSMQLRHHKGPVHTIPYGEIPKLTNYSRDWVIMKLKFTVPFDTDPNKVKKIFKTIGKEMMEVPEFAEDLLQPFKSQGVFDFDDVGMIIRGKFMAKPGRQFVLRKEIYNRVKKAFEENGIEFARREVRIAIPGLDGNSEDLTPEQKQAVAEGAAHAAQDAIAAQTPEPAKT